MFFISREKKIIERNLVNQLKNLCRIALSYGEEQIKALEILDWVYWDSAQNSRTPLARYFFKGKDDPVDRLYSRLKIYFEDKRKPGYENWGNLVYPQRVKKSRTDGG